MFERIGWQKYVMCSLGYFVTGCDIVATEYQEMVPEAVMLLSEDPRDLLYSDDSLHVLISKVDKKIISDSNLPHEIEARRLSFNAKATEKFPQIKPAANWPIIGGDATAGLESSLKVFDFGRLDNQLRMEALGVENLKVDLWNDRNTEVFQMLRALSEVEHYDRKVHSHLDLIDQLNDLLHLADQRKEGGVADRGEYLKIQFAVQETKRLQLQDMGSLNEAQLILSHTYDLPKYKIDVSNMLEALGACEFQDDYIQSPILMKAHIEQALADLEMNIVESRRFPILLLVSSVSVNLGTGALTSPINLSLDSEDLLTYRSKGTLEAARQKKLGAKANVAKLKNENEFKIRNLAARQGSLNKSEEIAKSLLINQQKTAELYEEKVVAGTTKLLEGIKVFTDKRDAHLSVLKVKFDKAMNCLELGNLTGTLIPKTYTIQNPDADL